MKDFVKKFANKIVQEIDQSILWENVFLDIMFYQYLIFTSYL